MSESQRPEGEIIWRSMFNSFNPDGTSKPPTKRYSELTDREKVIMLEWRDDLLCEEFNEETRNYESVMYKIRPHNDKRYRDQCTTFYDGCNCAPDHTQVEWNDLKDERNRLQHQLLRFSEALQHQILRYNNLIDANSRMRLALELIAAPMRPDGTWNRDREACRQLAAEALGEQL